jgi:hypothetical protein
MDLLSGYNHCMLYFNANPIYCCLLWRYRYIMCSGWEKITTMSNWSGIKTPNTMSIWIRTNIMCSKQYLLSVNNGMLLVHLIIRIFRPLAIIIASNIDNYPYFTWEIIMIFQLSISNTCIDLMNAVSSRSI